MYPDDDWWKGLLPLLMPWNRRLASQLAIIPGLTRRNAKAASPVIMPFVMPMLFMLVSIRFSVSYSGSWYNASIWLILPPPPETSSAREENFSLTMREKRLKISVSCSRLLLSPGLMLMRRQISLQIGAVVKYLGALWR